MTKGLTEADFGYQVFTLKPNDNKSFDTMVAIDNLKLRILFAILTQGTKYFNKMQGY